MRFSILRVFGAALLCLSFVSSKGQEITEFFFGEAQPVSSTNLSSFPEEFRGSYYTVSDSANTLVISDTAIILRSKILLTTTAERLAQKEEVSLVNGEIIGLHKKIGLPYFEDNKTLYFYFPHEAGFFRISPTQVLRRSEKGLILNFLERDNLWTPLTIELNKKGGMRMAAVDFSMSEDDIQEFKDVKTQRGANKITVVARPSDAEMNQYISGGGFSDKMDYHPGN